MSDAAIEADGLRKAFGQVTALDGLSLRVAAGSVLGLLGPNGSGKITTVSILSTALRLDGGRATVHGLDVVADAATEEPA
jgi:ABC-2 type transport system ATP-binding protein